MSPAFRVSYVRSPASPRPASRLDDFDDLIVAARAIANALQRFESSSLETKHELGVAHGLALALADEIERCSARRNGRKAMR